MHPTADALRTLQPLYRVHQGRKAGHPTVGQRLAGQRENHPHGGGIYGRADRCFGQLYTGGIDACWYPMHDARFGRAGWSVSLDVQGHYTYWTAVQDDFGNLVAVQ